ncbi:Zinc finger CCCH domain-containing protein 48 [Glycine soja]
MLLIFLDQHTFVAVHHLLYDCYFANGKFGSQKNIMDTKFARRTERIGRTTCSYWRAGRCNRNPCRFLHIETPSPPAACGYGNTAYNYGKKPHSSFENTLKYGSKKALLRDNGDRGDATRVAKAFKKSSPRICKYWINNNCVHGEQFLYLHSWFRGDGFSTVMKLQEHKKVITGIALPVGSDKLYSGSTDGTVRIWDCHTGQCAKVINLGAEVTSLISEGSWIFVGLQNAVKAWNIQTMSEFTLDGPKGRVRAMTVGNNTLFAGAEDGVIFAWRGSSKADSPFELVVSLTGHNKAVVCLAVGCKMLYSGSMDQSIKVWDMDTLQCTMTLNDHTDVVTSLICWDQYLLSSSSDRSIKVWACIEAGSLEVIYTHTEENKDVALIELCPGGLFFTGDESGLLMVWKWLESVFKFFLSLSKKDVALIELGPGGLFFTGDESGLLMVWKWLESVFKFFLSLSKKDVALIELGPGGLFFTGDESENSNRGSSVTLPRRFREQIREDFSSFFTVLRSFFEKKSISMNLGSMIEREEKRLVYRVCCSSDENNEEEEMEEGIGVCFSERENLILLLGVKLLVFDPSLQWVLILMLLIFLDQHSLLPFITCFTIVILGMENLGAKRFWNIMDTKFARRTERIGRTTCSYWRAGKCNRNPCRFVHIETPSPPAACGYGNTAYSYGKKPHSSSLNTPKYGSKKALLRDNGDRGDATRVAKAFKKSSPRICKYWINNNCVHGEQCLYLHSWFRGDGFSTVTKLQEHKKVITGIALPVGSDKLYSGSTDGTVRIWDCHTGQCAKVINLGAEVTSLISEGSWIFVGLQNAVKAWNIQTMSEFTLDGPKGRVRAMTVGNNTLFAGAEDGVIFAWRGSSKADSPFELVASLTGHTKAVVCLVVGCKMLYSGSMDQSIKVWDMDTLQCTMTLNDHTDAVTSLICLDQYLLSSSSDRTIKVWACIEAGSLEVIYTHTEENGVVSLFGMPDAEGKPILFSSCRDNSVHMYELPSFSERGRLFAKKDVALIELGPGGLFFTGDESGLLMVWKWLEKYQFHSFIFFPADVFFSCFDKYITIVKSLLTLLIRVKLLVFDPSLQWVLIWMLLIFLDQHSFVAVHHLLYDCYFGNGKFGSQKNIMDTKFARRTERIGSTTCSYWRAGRCNRNRCRFLHIETPSPPAACGYGNTAYSYGKKPHSSSENTPKYGSKKALLGDNGDRGDATRVAKAFKKSSPRICKYWINNNCVHGEQCLYLHSWFRGDGFSTVTKLHEHKKVITGIALPVGSDKLYSGSTDGTVRIWDCHTGQCAKVINLGAEVTSLISEGSWIFVGLQNAVKAWNIQTMSEFTLDGPKGRVRAMTVGNNTLFVGAEDGVIFAWRGSSKADSPFELVALLTGHTKAVVCLAVGCKMLYSGSMDQSIKVWDMDTLQCTMTLNDHTDVVTSLICWDQYLLSSSSDRTIKVWACIEAGSLEGVVSLFGMPDAEGKPILFSSCRDNSVYMYELPSFSERGRLFAKKDVALIELGPGGLFFTGDESGLLMVWKWLEKYQFHSFIFFPADVMFSCFDKYITIVNNMVCNEVQNPNRGASVTLPRRFREQIREDFPSFFTVLHSFFEKKSISMNLGSMIEREDKRLVYRVRCSSDENNEEEEMEEGIGVCFSERENLILLLGFVMDDLRESMFYPTSFISVKFSALPRCKYRVSRLGFLSIYLLSGVKLLVFDPSLQWVLILMLLIFLDQHSLLPFITCFTIVILGMENLGAKRFWNIMDTKFARRTERIGRTTCSYWRAGKCNRNPCRFVHIETPSPPAACGYGNTAYSYGKKPHSSSENTPKYGSKKALLGDNGDRGDATRVAKAFKKSSPRICKYWINNNCAHGEQCLYLHSWFRGDGFSTVTKLQEHKKVITGIALPVGSDKLYSGSTDGTVRIWDCHTGQCAKVINLGAEVTSLISEGSWIFVGLQNAVKAWNIQTMSEFTLDGPKGRVRAMTVGNNTLFAVAEDGVIFAWRGSSKADSPFELVASLTGHTKAVVCLAVGCKMLYSGSMDQSIKVWDMDTLQCTMTLNDHTDAVTSLICWDQYLLSSSSDRTIKVWACIEAGSLEVIYTHTEENGVVSLFGMPDAEGKPILFSSCRDNSVHMYELPSETINKPNTTLATKTNVCFSERENLILLLGFVMDDLRESMFYPTSFISVKLRVPFNLFISGVKLLVFDPSLQWVLIWMLLIFLDQHSFVAVHHLLYDCYFGNGKFGSQKNIMDTKFARRTERIGSTTCSYWRAGRCNRNPCRFLHIETPSPPAACGYGNTAYSNGKKPHSSSENTPKYGSKKALLGDNGDRGDATRVTKAFKKSSPRICKYWINNNCVHGEQCLYLHSWFRGDGFSTVTKLHEHKKVITGIALPVGSDKLYSGSTDGTVRIWDCHTGQCAKVINLGAEVTSLISEGSWIFVGLQNAVKAWNIQTMLEYTLDGPKGRVRAMTVGNNTLFAGAEDGVIFAWRGSSKADSPFELVASLTGHTKAVVCLAVGCKMMYSGSMDQSIKVWDMDTLQCTMTLNDHTDVVTSLICWDQYLLSSSSDRTIKVWACIEVGSLEVIYTHTEENGVVSLFGMPDAEGKPILFSSCRDNSVHMYELPSFSERGRLFAKKDVALIELGPGGLFFTGDESGLLMVWKWLEKYQFHSFVFFPADVMFSCFDKYITIKSISMNLGSMIEREEKRLVYRVRCSSDENNEEEEMEEGIGSLLTLLIRVKLLVFDPSLQWVLILMLLIFLDQHSFVAVHHLLYDCYFGNGKFGSQKNIMDTKFARRTERIGRTTCSYWRAGKCNRNPCRFLHIETPSPPAACGYGNTAYSYGKKPHSSSENTPKYGSKKALLGDNGDRGDATRVAKAFKKSSPRICKYWINNNCVHGEQCLYLHSWFRGDGFSTVTKLQEHKKVITGIALPVGSDKLYSGSTDGTVRIWDCHTGQCAKVINLGAEVTSLISEGSWIFVGLQNAVKAWNIQTMLEFTLDGPKGRVRAMTVGNNTLFAGAEDGVIFAWRGSSKADSPFELVASLTGHTKAVVCLAVGCKMLYSGSMDQSIKVWDMDTLQCTMTLNDHTDAVTSLICWDQYLLSSSSDRTIKVWACIEAGSLEVIYTHTEENGVVSLFGMPDAEGKPILFSSCRDNSVHIFSERGRLFAKKDVALIELGPGGLFFTGDESGLLMVWKWLEVPKVASSSLGNESFGKLDFSSYYSENMKAMEQRYCIAKNGEEAEFQGSLTPMLCISAVFGGKKMCFHEENPSRGASITVPRRFREQIREDFPSFFTVLRSFFGLQSGNGRIKRILKRISTGRKNKVLKQSFETVLAKKKNGQWLEKDCEKELREESPSTEKKSISMNLGSMIEREEKRLVYRVRCSSDENNEEEEMEEGIGVS